MSTHDITFNVPRCRNSPVGDVVVTPATGAYGFSMSNTYNGVPRAFIKRADRVIGADDAR